jgi:hypothetical protein
MLAFVHIEKTAGITINWILRRSFGLRHCDVLPWRKGADFFSAEDYRRIQRLYPRIESLAGHDVKPYSDLDQVRPDIRYFTFVREPLARCASHYQYQIQVMGKRVSFEDWINTERYRNWQTKKLAGKADLDASIRTLKGKFIFVGLSERFDESLVVFKNRASSYSLNVRYNSRNVATDNKIKNQLLGDSRTKACLVEANNLDLSLYEFVSQELYPRQKQEYGDTLSSDLAAFQQANHGLPIDWNLISSFLKRRLVYNPILYCYQACNRV